MDYTTENLRQQLNLSKEGNLIPLLDAVVSSWLEQLPQRAIQTNSPITHFEDLGEGDYRIVVSGKLNRLRVYLEDKSVYDPDTSLYMATKVSCEGDSANMIIQDLETFTRNCNLTTLEQRASQKFMKYMEIAD